MHDFITATSLAERLDDDMAIVDCRFDLQHPKSGRQAYEQGHIPGAVYFDLNEDLAAIPSAHGGRHPLPNTAEFTAKLGRAGIHNDTHVVVYDDQNWAFAGRLWWLLRYLGHDRVSVLAMTFSEWQNAGYPVTTVIPQPVMQTFTPHVRTDMVVNRETVQQQKDDDDVVLIDSRAPGRFRGEFEPMDAVAGHIPGAVNRFFGDNMTTDGHWRSAAALTQRFQDIEDKQKLVYCGSGVTATVNLLALRQAGQDAALYVGGWSDWSSYDHEPVARGDEN